MTNSNKTATVDTTTTCSSAVHFTTSPPDKIGTKRSAWESNEESPCSSVLPSVARFIARSSSCTSVSSATSRDSLILPPKRSSCERRSATRDGGSTTRKTKSKSKISSSRWEQQHKSLPEDFLVGFDDDVDKQTLPSSIKKSTSLLSMSLSSGEDKLLKRSHDRRRQYQQKQQKQTMSSSMSSPSLISLSSLSGGGSSSGSSSSRLSCSTLPTIKPIKEEEVSEDSEDEGFYIGGGYEDEDDNDNKMEDDDDDDDDNDVLFQQMKMKQQTLLNKINKMQATITASVSSPSLSSLPGLLSTSSNHRRPKTPTKSILKNSPSQHEFVPQVSVSSSDSESESESYSNKPERRKKRNKKKMKIKVNNDTTETNEAIGSIKMIQLNDTTEGSVSRSKRRLRTNSSSSNIISTNSNSNSNNSSPSTTSKSIQKSSALLSRKHRDSVLDIQSFMIKKINKGEDVDKSLRPSSASLISMLTVKDGDGDDDDEEEEVDPTLEDIMYNNTTEQDPIHNDDDDEEDEDTDLDSDDDYNEDDEALSQCTSRSWSLFEKAMEMEKKVLESYENL